MNRDKRLSKYGQLNFLGLIRAEDLAKCQDDCHLFISVFSGDIVPYSFLNGQHSGSQLRQAYKPLRYQRRRFFELNDYLEELQENLFRVLLDGASVSDIAHGYLQERSIFTNFTVHHQGNPKTQLRIDLYRAFYQITSERLSEFLLKQWPFDQLKTLLKKQAEWFAPPKDSTFRWWAFSGWPEYQNLLNVIENRFDEKCYQSFLALIVRLFLYPQQNGHGYLAQGATISPWLFNLVLYELDEKLKEMVRPHGYCITRFGDDIVITTSDKYFPQEIVDNIFVKIAELGFKINWRKSGIRHLTPDSPLLFPGLILYSDGIVGTRQRSRRRMRARLFQTKNTSKFWAVQGGINSYLKKVFEIF